MNQPYSISISDVIYSIIYLMHIFQEIGVTWQALFCAISHLKVKKELLPNKIFSTITSKWQTHSQNVHIL